MKAVSIFWLSLSGLGVFVLLGQLLDYADLRLGVGRIIGLIAILLFGAGAVNVVIFAARGFESRDELMASVKGSVLLAGGVLVVILLIMLIGAF